MITVACPAKTPSELSRRAVDDPSRRSARRPLLLFPRRTSEVVLDTFLWILQVILALIFIGFGYLHTFAFEQGVTSPRAALDVGDRPAEHAHARTA